MSEFLILGATGKTGRRVTTKLAAAGHVVRAAARTPGAASDDVVPTPFDWADPSGWDAALRGADAVYVVPPAMSVTFAPQVAALLERAHAVGVPHAVFLSARGAEQAPEGAMFRAEAALWASPLTGTVVRPTWFLQNFSEGFFRPGLDEGVLAAPAGDGAVPFVDTDDIAAVAAAALVDPARHAGETYLLTGPEALTFAETADVLSSHLGRPVAYVDLAPDLWLAQAVENGIPEEYARLLAGLFASIRAGAEVTVDPGVQRALDREPRSFAGWLDHEGEQLRAPTTV